MRNIKTKIIARNRKMLQNKPSKKTKHYNFQQKDNCPINGTFLKVSLVYYTTLSCKNKNYIPKYIHTL